MIFDTHAHYDDEAFDEDRDQLLSSFPTNGIQAVVNIGASIQTTKSTLELTRRYAFVYGAVGVHPNETGELNDHLLDWLKDMARQPKVVAVGEIGLDYYWDEPDRGIQKKWFERQLQLAREVKLPVIIHSREAAKDTLDIMKAAHGEELGGVVHCFSYTKEIAKEYLDMDYYFGIGGVVTFQNGKKLKEVVEYLPIEKMLLETDSPYLAPVPYRGKRNSSLYIPLIAEEIAKIKGMDYDEVVRVTEGNAKSLFGIGE